MENEPDLVGRLKIFAEYLDLQAEDHKATAPIESIAGSFHEEHIASEYQNTLKKFYELFPEVEPEK